MELITWQSYMIKEGEPDERLLSFDANIQMY